MIPIQFEESNTVLKKPADMTDEQCMELPVHRGRNPEGFPCIISCWKLSKEDIEQIQKTGVIWLNVIGNTTPPVSLMAENPFRVDDGNDPNLVA